MGSVVVIIGDVVGKESLQMSLISTGKALGFSLQPSEVLTTVVPGIFPGSQRGS